MKNQENQKNQNNQEVQENNSSKFNRMTSRMLQIKAETASNEEIKDRPRYIERIWSSWSAPF